MEIPTAIYAALGAVTAALIAGFFSFATLVSAKENKVSEFRLSWINGLRDEISDYTAAIQRVARISAVKTALKDDELSSKSIEERKIEWLCLTSDAYDKAVLSLSKIQLRLNPVHVQTDPGSNEAKLFNAVIAARGYLNDKNYIEAIKSSTPIREAAAPLLKSTWDLVKDGEPGYQVIRVFAQSLIIAMASLLLASSGLLLATYFFQSNSSTTAASACSQAPIIINR